MASRTAPRALRSSIGRLMNSTATPVRRQSFSTALAATTVRSTRKASRSIAVTPLLQQSRSVKTVDFAGTKETVYGMLLHD